MQPLSGDALPAHATYRQIMALNSERYRSRMAVILDRVVAHLSRHPTAFTTSQIILDLGLDVHAVTLGRELRALDTVRAMPCRNNNPKRWVHANHYVLLVAESPPRPEAPAEPNAVAAS